jgi:hypothetical protein
MLYDSPYTNLQQNTSDASKFVAIDATQDVRRPNADAIFSATSVSGAGVRALAANFQWRWTSLLHTAMEHATVLPLQFSSMVKKPPDQMNAATVPSTSIRRHRGHRLRTRPFKISSLIVSKPRLDPSLRSPPLALALALACLTTAVTFKFLPNLTPAEAHKSPCLLFLCSLDTKPRCGRKETVGAGFRYEAGG